MLSLFKKNLLLVIVILVGVSGFLLPHVSEAKSVQWSIVESNDLAYYWNNGQAGATGWDKGLRAPIISVQYQANVYDNNTNALISDGASIPVGTTVRFQPTTYNDCDITWFASGFTQDSPCGHWISGAAAPTFSCLAGDISGTNVSDDLGNQYNTYAPLSVNPPASSIDISGSTATLTQISPGVYRVDGSGSIVGKINYAATNGEFYYRYLMTYKSYSALNTNQCYGNQTAQETITSATPPSFCIVSCSTAWTFTHQDYSLQVPQQTITFTLTAVSNNNPPTTPTITGPTTGTPNTAYDFTISGGTDPDGDQVRYGITDSTCTAVTQWLPGSGYFNPGSQTYAGKSWASPGIYKIYVLSEDSKTGRSACATKTISIATLSGSSCTVAKTQINDADGFVDMRGAAECQGNNYLSTSESGGTAMYASYLKCPIGVVDGGVSNVGACFGDIKFTPSSGPASRCQVYSYECSGPPPTTATLLINNSAGPITVSKNTTVNLAWSSTNAPSCTKWGGAWGSGESVGVSGSDTTIVTATTDYMVSCAGVTSVVHIDVVNQTPTPPTITYVSGTRTTNQPVTFTILGTDPDNDNIFYEVDWDNDGTVDATTMTVPSNTAQNATHTWTTSGNQTFQARTVDLGGARSTWTQHSETIIAAPPTATLMVSVNNGPYTTTAPTVDPGDTLSMQWSSTDTTNCAATQGSGFAASGPSGTDPVNSPAPNTSDTFQVTCTGPGGNATAAVAVSTRQKPNFNQPNMTISNPGTFDPVTATYGYVDIIFSTANNGGSATKSAAPYQVDFTGKPAITGSIPSGLTVGAAGYNTTVRVPGPITFGTATVKVSIDTPIATNGSVPEVTEGDADNTRTATLTIPPPDPGLTLTADKVRLRNTETTTIRWSIATTYAGLSCQTRGPGINTTSQAGNQSTPPVTAKNEYIFKCVEGTTGTTWQRTATVETEGVIEEI